MFNVVYGCANQSNWETNNILLLSTQDCSSQRGKSRRLTENTGENKTLSIFWLWLGWVESDNVPTLCFMGLICLIRAICWSCETPFASYNVDISSCTFWILHIIRITWLQNNAIGYTILRPAESALDGGFKDGCVRFQTQKSFFVLFCLLASL